MTRREAIASVVGIFAVALVARVLFASQIVFPKPEDTAYYFGVARNLVEGRGLVSDALWSYQTPPLAFPRAAFEVWLPLPSLLAAIPMALFGATFAAAQWASVVLGAIVPVLAWRLAADVAEERGLPAGRARVLADRHRADLRGLPAAAPPFRPARLDDAVRRPRPRGLPADGAHRPRAARRPRSSTCASSVSASSSAWPP